METAANRDIMDNIMEHKTRANDGEDISQDSSEFPLSVLFSNQLLMSRVLSFLPTSTLKDCRLVNSTWYEEASRLYFNFPKGALQFILNGGRKRKREDGRTIIEEDYGLGEDFPKKLQLLKQFKIKSFNIDLSSTPILTPEQCSNHHTIEAISQIEGLLERYGPKLEYLNLKMNMAKPPETLPMMAYIFKNLSNLQEIVLDLYAGTDLAKHGGHCLPPLATVRSVKLGPHCFSMPGSSQQVNNDNLVSNVFTIMRLFPNVKSISLPDDDGCLIPLVLFRYIDPKYLPMPHLRELNITIDGAATFYTKEILLRLATLRNGLEALTLKIQGYSGSGDTTQIIPFIEDVLHRHGPTLRSLKMKILQNSPSEEVQLIFPKCPKLQVLKIWMNQDFRMSFSFPAGHISYTADFPRMEELYVEIFPQFLFKETDITDPDTTSFHELGRNFLGNGALEQEKCLTMKRAEFVIPRNWMKPHNLEWGERILKQIQTTFPNASRTPMEKMMNWVNDV